MLKLRRLRVERFRSLPKNTELAFSDGINIVIGQNGTGKTTLLELISMVVRSDFSSLAKEEFAVEYELSVPDGESIIMVVQNKRVGQTPIELGGREDLRLSIEMFGAMDRRRLLSYDAEHGLSVDDAQPQNQVTVLTPEEQGFLISLINQLPNFRRHFLASLILAQSTHRLDESLDIFRHITRTGDLAGDLFLIRGHLWIPNPFVLSLIPHRLVDILRLSVASKRPDYSFTHDELDLLAELKNIMGFSAAELRVDVTKRSNLIIGVGNFVFRFWWSDGTLISHDRLSYGQKRLLTFLYYLACNLDIVIADELVNGLHHRWITASIEALGQRQAFLTSQNPLLLDYVPITSVEEVRRSFVLCRGEPRDGRPGWIWENMSQADAEELYRAYQVGVEHVSEILQSRELW